MHGLEHKIPILDYDDLEVDHRKSIVIDKSDPRCHEPLVKLDAIGLAFESYFAKTDGKSTVLCKN